jgi:hypothetical protein
MRRPRKTTREMSEWVLHCAVNQRHIRRSQPTRKAALKDACWQLLQGHAVNRIVGPNETITAERVRGLVCKTSTLTHNAIFKLIFKPAIEQTFYLSGCGGQRATIRAMAGQPRQ